MVSWYGQPSGQLLRTTKATALQGSVLEMLAEEANTTYTVQFNGPSVQCNAIPSDIMEDCSAPFHCDPRPASAEVNASCPRNFEEPRSLQTNRVTYMYIGWIPDAENVVLFDNTSLISPALPSTEGSLGSHPGGPVSVFLASRNSMTSDDWQVLNCSFFNATSTADFAFDERKRAVPSIQDVHAIGPIIAFIETPWHSNTTLGPKNAVFFNYMPTMQSLCDILYGMIYTPVAADSPLANDASQWGMLMGQTALGATRDINPFMSTAVKKPIVNDGEWTFPAVQPSYPPNATDEERFSIAFPTRFFSSPSFGKPLGPAIEEPFHNMTLSLYSDPSYLRLDDTPVNVSTSRSQTIYIYNAARLLLSYGIASGLACLVSIVGLAAVFINKGSHSNRNSTYLRTIKQPEFQNLKQSGDGKGADPLPRCIADSKVEWRDACASLLDADSDKFLTKGDPRAGHQRLKLIAHVDQAEVDSASIDRSEYSR